MAQYAIMRDGQPEPYTLRQLRADNPNITFPRRPSEELLAEYQVFPVTSLVDETTDDDEVLEDKGLVVEDDRVVRRKRRRKRTREERQAARREKRKDRREKFLTDMVEVVLPAFIAYHMGEVTEEEWREAYAEAKEWRDR